MKKLLKTPKLMLITIVYLTLLSGLIYILDVPKDILQIMLGTYIIFIIIFSFIFRAMVRVIVFDIFLGDILNYKKLKFKRISKTWVESGACIVSLKEYEITPAKKYAILQIQLHTEKLSKNVRSIVFDNKNQIFDLLSLRDFICLDRLKKGMAIGIKYNPNSCNQIIVPEVNTIDLGLTK